MDDTSNGNTIRDSAQAVAARAARTLPATTRRVAKNPPDDINRDIQQQIEASVRYYAQHPEQIGRRLAELDREWDIERTLEANAATVALTGTVLGILVNRRFLGIPLLAIGFLLQHALQGWCPPVAFFRRRGVRTAEEIAEERCALKALRGDFRNADQAPDALTRANAALIATRI
jgi:hypothetical protein